MLLLGAFSEDWANIRKQSGRVNFALSPTRREMSPLKGIKSDFPVLAGCRFFSPDHFPMLSAFVPSLCGKKQMAFIFLFCCKMSRFQMFQQQIKLKQQ